MQRFITVDLFGRLTDGRTSQIDSGIGETFSRYSLSEFIGLVCRRIRPGSTTVVGGTFEAPTRVIYWGRRFTTPLSSANVSLPGECSLILLLLSGFVS